MLACINKKNHKSLVHKINKAPRKNRNSNIKVNGQS